VTKTDEEERILNTLKGNERIAAYLRFVDRAKSNPIGRRVKCADIYDNLNVTRIGKLTDKDIFRINQYKAALKHLEER